MENHFIELGETTFSAVSLLVYFRESLYKISKKLFFSEKLFDRAPARISFGSCAGAPG